MRLLLLLALLLVVSYASTSRAQYGPYWEKIGQIPIEAGQPIHITCGYFWSRSEGIVGVENICPFHNDCGSTQLYYTEDGKWVKAVYPPYQLGGPRQIVMKDRDTGYAVFEAVQTDAPLGAMKTTNGGRTWEVYRLFGESLDAVITRSGELLYTHAGVGPFIGTTQPNTVRGNSITSAEGAWITVDRDHLRYSYDDGQTWGIRPLTAAPAGVLRGSYGITYSSKYKTLVVAPEYIGMNGPIVSTDTGHTFFYQKDWGGAFTREWYGTGDIRGGRDAMYVQNWTTGNARPNGILRSVDGGYHWKDVNGPNNTIETRFFVSGCTGATVYAFDTLGGIWYTETGGDGTMPREIYNHPIFSGPRSVTSALCQDTLIMLPFLNELCADFRIDSIGWITSDASLDPKLVSSGTLTLTHPALPQTYKSETGDTVTVGWSPGKLFDHDTTFTRKIFIRYLSGSDLRMHDTTISITLTAKSMAPRIAMDRSAIDFDATSTCFSRDTTVTFTNTSCDTLTIDSLIGRGAFELSGITTPLRVAPGENVTLGINFHPQTQGPQFGNVHLDATHQGIQRGFDIPLSGIGAPGAGLLELMSSKDVELSELSICASADTLAMLQNIGCDTIIVKNVAITGSSDYTLASTVQNVVLPPDSSLAFRIIFKPQDKGARNGAVTITWTDEKGNNPKEIKITLGTNVIDGTKVLASSLNWINFGQTNICEERDSIVTLKNNGCDTLTITSVDVDKNFAVGGSFPIVLAPGESIDVLITTLIDTVGKPTILEGVLSLTSTADNQIAPITLTRGLYYPTKLRIEAVDEASGRVGDEVRFRVILEGQVPLTMTALHFDFLHNNDLLSWDGYDGIGLNRTSISGNENERASFMLSPVHDGVVGELRFRTRLAIAEQTTLSFDNITFEAAGLSIAPECIAVISDSGTRFNYIYTCGDNIIRDRLNGTRLIKSITPNPASNEIRLELSVTDAKVSVIDMLGVEVLRTTSSRINVSSLPSGTYYVRVCTTADVQTKRVVISR